MASANRVSDTDTTFTSNTSTFTANIPATSANDRMLAIMATWASRTWGAAPTGWTQAATSGDYLHVYEKVGCSTASATTADFTFTGGTTVGIVRVILISGGHVSTVASISSFGTGNTANPDPPNLNPAVSDDWLWFAIAHWSHLFGTDRARTAVPSNYTATTDVDIQPSNGELEFSVAWRQTTASSENPGTFTLDGAPQTGRQVTIGIPSAPSVAGRYMDASTQAQAALLGY